jgi:hypothetical protein
MSRTSCVPDWILNWLCHAFHAAWRDTAVFCRLLGYFVAKEQSLVGLKDGARALVGAGLRVTRLAHADECAPSRGKGGGDQHIRWMIAEHAAIFTHLPADGADFMIARGVKQSGKDNEGGGDIFHGKSRLVVRHLRDDRALTRRANQAQINMIAKIIWPAPPNWQRDFC